ncbi:MAG: VOC family protein [Alphaproteobacteria bacterium]|nr:VOC family protein [Alphaproteobacteria bacterium]MCA0449672.1 VOC family protein [Pseudomonadota bacterium]
MKPLAGIDHALVGVADLEAARELWTRLGFTLSPRGRHKGWGTGNYCAMFAHDYVELLGIVDPAGFDNGLNAMLAAQGPGLLGFAAATDDVGAAVELLTKGGIPHERKALSRLLELPDGDVEPAFDLAMPLKPYPAGMKPFVCAHLTRDLVWRPEWIRHANSATGIASLTFVAEDPIALRDPFEAILGLGAVTATDDTLAVRWGTGAPLMIVKPDDLSFLHPAVASDEPVRMGFAGMTIAVGDVAAARAALKAGGFDYEKDLAGAVHVAPDDAGGLALSFEKA